ncbi:putative membrane protein, partial [Yersinia pestis PY-65]
MGRKPTLSVYIFVKIS